MVRAMADCSPGREPGLRAIASTVNSARDPGKRRIARWHDVGVKVAVHRWGVRGVAAGCLVAAGVGVGAMAPAQAAASACPQVAVIAARGSGQADGAGAQLEGTFAALQAARPSTTMQLLPVAYPALGAEYALLNPAAFTASINHGARSMRNQAAGVAARCPTTQIVLAGFSQGAMVAHQAVRDRVTARRATAVLLMADGFRTRVDRVAYLPIGPARARGVVVANARAAAPGPVPALHGTGIGVCLTGDVVCDWTDGADLGAGARLHSTGYLDPRVQQAAAQAVAARLD